MGDVKLELKIEPVRTGGYTARIENMLTGESTERTGETVGDLVQSGLSWAEAYSYRISSDSSLASIREKIAEYASEAGNEYGYDFEVKIFTCF